MDPYPLLNTEQVVNEGCAYSLINNGPFFNSFFGNQGEEKSNVDSPASSEPEDHDDQSSNVCSERRSFPYRLWYLLGDIHFANVIYWSDDGNYVVFPDMNEFERSILNQTQVFKTRKLKSFVRQLNLYGFHKIPPRKLKGVKVNEEVGYQACAMLSHPFFAIFQHPYFRRGFPEGLEKVKRRCKIKVKLNETIEAANILVESDLQTSFKKEDGCLQEEMAGIKVPQQRYVLQPYSFAQLQQWQFLSMQYMNQAAALGMSLPSVVGSNVAAPTSDDINGASTPNPPQMPQCHPLPQWVPFQQCSLPEEGFTVNLNDVIASTDHAGHVRRLFSP